MEEQKKQWSEMTWEERREERFKRWLDTRDIKFVSPEAKKKYKERATRMIKAIKLEIPDRVPLHITSGTSLIAYNAGYTLKDLLYDYRKIRPAWVKWLNDYDQDSNDAPLLFSARVYELLDYKVIRWPGGGLPDNASMHNFVEKEYMLADEYDLFIKDQFDFALRKFTPRTWGAFEFFADIPPFSSYQGIPQRLMQMCLDPRFQKLFKLLKEAAEENEHFQQALGECATISLEMGFPPLGGGSVLAPFDTIADMLRGTVGASMDMYRQPEKLLEALEVICERSLQQTVAMAQMSRSPVIFIPMHKGDDSFMSVKQFEKFYWPTFRKLLLGLINEGLVPM
ncbi:MAG: hypothetical protein N2506_07255, partial [Dehalococcoidales bacterium]|nr:hypothetical protein [Dehalococcoidales bacterium]